MMRSALTLTLLATAALATACGDDTDPTGPGPGAAGGGATVVPHGDDSGSAAAAPAVTALPDVPRLDAATAQAAATHDVAAAAEDSVAAVALLGLSARGAHAEAVQVARAKLLVREGDDYADPYMAAIGLEVLLAAGEPGAAQAALALAESFIAEEEPEISGDVVSMLERIEGPERKRAEDLIARIAEIGDDTDDGLAAVYALGERRGTGHLDVLVTIARDTARYEGIRAAAAAGVLNAGDPRGESLVTAVLGTSDADPVDLIAGLSVRGAQAVLPHVKNLVERALARGSAEPEFDAACYTLADAFAGHDGAPARETIATWLTRDGEFEGDAATYALWMLGDDARANDVRRILVREITSSGSHDVELAVLLLDEIGERGLATDERFRDAVDAAAQIDIPAGADPAAASRLRWLQIAAANAFLRSTEK